MERHPITAQRVIGSQIVREGNLTVRYTWVTGHDPELGFGQYWLGHTGVETRFRQVVPTVAETWNVDAREEEAA